MQLGHRPIDCTVGVDVIEIDQMRAELDLPESLLAAHLDALQQMARAELAAVQTAAALTKQSVHIVDISGRAIVSRALPCLMSLAIGHEYQ